MADPLGIRTTSREVHLAAIEDDETVDGATATPAALDAGEALIEFVDSVRRVLLEIRPDALHLLPARDLQLPRIDSTSRTATVRRPAAGGRRPAADLCAPTVVAPPGPWVS